MRFRKKNTSTPGKPRSLLRKIIRTAVYVFLGTLLLLIGFSVYFYVDRDEIGKKILLYSNQITRGELSFEDITFNPFKHFPSLSLTLVEVSYYEHSIGNRNQNEEAIVDIGRLYAAIDIKDLISGEINVSRIYLQNGNIRLVRYPDSTLNLLNAFQPVVREHEMRTEAAGQAIADTLSDPDPSELMLDLRQISFQGIRVAFDDRIERDKEALSIERLRASFSYTPEEIRAVLETQLDLEWVRLSDKVLFREKDLGLETAVVFGRQDQMLKIAPSRLSIDQALMNIGGEIDFRENDKFFLEVDGSDHDFSIFQLFLTREGLKNFRSGDLYFRGSITGIPGREIPMADFTFGLDEVRLYVPLADDYIQNLNLSGSFTSGSKGDLSLASLNVDTVQADLPAGHLRASMHLENFNAPRADLLLDMDASLTGLDEIIRIDFIDSLSGNIDADVKILGLRKDPDSNRVVADDFSLEIACKDIAFSIPEVLSFRKADGNIYLQRDTTWLEDFTVLADDSDFFINGYIINGLFLPFRVEENIYADLEVQSELFDLPGFLSFVPELGESFPYRINDAQLGVYVSTSTSKMLDFEANPSMDFEIRHLEGTIEGFLPRTSNISGQFSLGEQLGRTHLDFRDFGLDILDGSLQADLEIFNPAPGNTHINMSVKTHDVNPGQVFWGGAGDSVPDFLNGPLNGSFQLDLHFPDDELIKMKKLDLRRADLYFINVKDTFRSEGLHLLARDVYWDTGRHPNIFHTLNAEVEEHVDKLETDYFEVRDLKHDILIEDGVFHIKTDKSLLFATPGQGEYTIAPFQEIPYYQVQFEMNEFEADDLMSAFRNDTLIVGTMNLKLDIKTEGREREEILESINGEVLIYGEDLTLYGVDLDGIIKQFKRSQNFNLVDVGAVMFAGPAGLALTKGGAYASMLVIDYEETSPVSQIVSDWEIQNGTIVLRDVAFATRESRVAAKGWLDFQKDSLDISFAVIDQKGCNVIGQDLYGNLRAPEKSRLKIISTLLAPVTNLLDLTLGIDCEPFYEGRIAHPQKDN